MNGPGGAQVQLSFRRNDPEIFDEILVCTGRTPNVEGLGLDAAHVELTKEGRVRINDSLQTTNPNIYAVGDVCMSTQFTHVAGESAQLVVRNALCNDTRRWSELAVPWATYTHPGLSLLLYPSLSSFCPFKPLPFVAIDALTTQRLHTLESTCSTQNEIKLTKYQFVPISESVRVPVKPIFTFRRFSWMLYGADMQASWKQLA